MKLRGGSFNVRYNKIPVKSQELPRIKTQMPPSVYIPPGHTLILYDPDAPGGTYIHWLVGKKTYLSYKPPSPPKGIHRYIFKLVEGEPLYIPERVGNPDIIPGRVKGSVMFYSR